MDSPQSSRLGGIDESITNANDIFALLRAQPEPEQAEYVRHNEAEPWFIMLIPCIELRRACSRVSSLGLLSPKAHPAKLAMQFADSSICRPGPSHPA
jgi:hypothetical protein